MCGPFGADCLAGCRAVSQIGRRACMLSGTRWFFLQPRAFFSHPRLFIFTPCRGRGVSALTAPVRAGVLMRGVLVSTVIHARGVFLSGDMFMRARQNGRHDR